MSLERIANVQMGNAVGPDPEYSRVPVQQKRLSLLARRSDDPIRAYKVLKEYSLRATTARERSEFNTKLNAFLQNGASISYSTDGLVRALESKTQPVPEFDNVHEDDDPFREFAPMAADYRDLIGGYAVRNMPKTSDVTEEAHVPDYEHPLKA